ncbi:hypothetical protein IMG5_174330, partial [Ichthyophthirius multifiliis]
GSAYCIYLDKFTGDIKKPIKVKQYYNENDEQLKQKSNFHSLIVEQGNFTNRGFVTKEQRQSMYYSPVGSFGYFIITQPDRQDYLNLKPLYCASMFEKRNIPASTQAQILNEVDEFKEMKNILSHHRKQPIECYLSKQGEDKKETKKNIDLPIDDDKYIDNDTKNVKQALKSVKQEKKQDKEQYEDYGIADKDDKEVSVDEEQFQYDYDE